MSKLILPAALLAVLLCPAEVLAHDYGQRGTVFPVIERDLLEQIHSRLMQMERSGESARLATKPSHFVREYLRVRRNASKLHALQELQDFPVGLVQVLRLPNLRLNYCPKR